jgi:hypothetical protein
VSTGNTAMEVWLKKIETGLRESIYAQVENSLKEFFRVDSKDFNLLDWIKKFSGQVLVVCLHIQFSMKMDEVFASKRKQDDNGSFTLKDLQKEVLDSIKELSREVRQKLDENSRITIYNMLINRIHARDVVKGMIEERVEEAEEFFWKIQMKYHYVQHKGLPKPESAGDSGPGKGR